MKINRLLLLSLILLSVITSCKPVLREFQPDNKSLFNITFSYPSEWEWREEVPYDEMDPSEEIPPSELFRVESQSIEIQVFQPINPQTKMQEWMDGYLGVVTPMLVSDSTIRIDGYDARWFTVLYPPQTSEKGFIQEVVYLLIDDRFYTIELNSWDPVNKHIQKEFEEMVNSIKVIR